ncbi:hypothetical protein A2872_03065 [Candidatus Gottesmanbacteria bacterium RIFCSPHIGHO2_01_FULL_42_12]|uniref:N-acetylmuramoyl-L-alanine amidase domain-containing protein n=1 Tax=Candidatus Gottesmanbacteria bacterium RIFCSPHIGHO2_01_FULL_42_12 TaxID=1798377 RepID=A0A1F5Z0E6_9BACT|nr:MAG: hypothetical protein A2872_03065 [Candidatus Gottesmanbacteria bacterium RIFCSPHIGHO2_01_FULL_42_12]
MKLESKTNEEKLKYWTEQLQYPDWYIRLEDYLKTTIYPIIHDDLALKAERHTFYALVEEMLEDGLIPLAENGPDLDAERQPIDTIVVHHTEGATDITLSELSAIGFIRQYGLNYLNDNVWGVTGLKGQPIWSGHFREGKMVFFAYHWLIRPDGKAERLLEDKYIGHHAMQINPRSIGITLSGNYEHSVPPIAQIRAVADTIKSYYNFVQPDRILGHCEVMKERTCPGDKFLTDWKKTLVNLAK